MRIKTKFKCAANGVLLAMKDKSILIQFVAFVLVVLASLYFHIKLQDFLIILLVSCVVIVCEIINTCIERICDMYKTEFDERILYIKDLSAAAVLISSIFAVVIGCLIFLKYIGG